MLSGDETCETQQYLQECVMPEAFLPLILSYASSQQAGTGEFNPLNIVSNRKIVILHFSLTLKPKNLLVVIQMGLWFASPK